MLNVSCCIIHEVLKEAKSENIVSAVSLDLSDSLLDNEDEFVVKLIDRVHTSFSENSSIKNTHFEPNQATKFSTLLNEYLEQKQLLTFLSYSVQSLNALKELIEKENFATGGYYIFSDYTYDGRRFLSVMVVRKNRDAINFSKIGGSYRPTHSENINTEKIAMGFRLNHGLYVSTDDERNYIAILTSGNAKDLSGYFKNWVNAAGIITSDKNTTAFVDIIKRIDLPKNEDGVNLCTREEFQTMAHQFAERSPSKILNINTFSSFAYGEQNSDYVMKYAQREAIVIDPEFKRSIKVVKRLVTVRAAVPGIELNVDYNRLNTQEVDVQDTMIIIRSADLVKQIKDQK